MWLSPMRVALSKSAPKPFPAMAAGILAIAIAAESLQLAIAALPVAARVALHRLLLACLAHWAVAALELLHADVAAHLGAAFALRTVAVSLAFHRLAAFALAVAVLACGLELVSVPIIDALAALFAVPYVEAAGFAEHAAILARVEIFVRLEVSLAVLASLCGWARGLLLRHLHRCGQVLALRVRHTYARTAVSPCSRAESLHQEVLHPNERECNRQTG